MNQVNIDVADFRQFFNKMGQAANGPFKQELQTFLEGLGEEFLRILQDEIVRRKVLDTRQLLISFERGTELNVWQITDDGLTLEVGTNVDYASYVNDGHWTNPKGVQTRFVPGYWSGDRFIYDPSAKGGMVLKQHWVDGKHYWESALRILDRIYPKLLEAKLQEWLERYFDE